MLPIILASLLAVTSQNEWRVIRADDVIGPRTDRPVVEPHLAASPTDPSHMLAGAIVADAAEAFSTAQTCQSLVTFDAGKTWSTHTFDLQGCGDPWVAVGWDGDAWFSALGRRGASTAHRLWVFRSTDGGRTWLEPTDFGGGQDHQTMLVAPPESKDRGWVYVISGLGRRDRFARFHVYVARSEDRGRTWYPPLILTPNNLNFNSLAGGLLADGSLLIPFADLQRAPYTMPDMLTTRRVWAYRIEKGGAGVSPSLFISESCTRQSGFPSLTVVQQPFRAVLACSSAGANGVIVHGSDDAAAWTAPAAVDPQPAGVTQRTPSIASNASGAVAVTWMDSRDAPAGCMRLRAAVSWDAGRTFTASRDLSTGVSCPASGSNGAAATRWPSGGDYLALASTSDGRFHALWPDSRDGVFQLRFVTFGRK